jgi:hypothetical protein
VLGAAKVLDKELIPFPLKYRAQRRKTISTKLFTEAEGKK